MDSRPRLGRGHAFAGMTEERTGMTQTAGLVVKTGGFYDRKTWFDGHQVDWDNLIMRQRRYMSQEYRSFSLWERDNWHKIMYVAPHEKERLLMMQQG